MVLLEYIRTRFGKELDEKEIEFVNVTLNKDYKGYIDPFRLLNDKTELGIRMQQKVLLFFDSLLNDIDSGKGYSYIDAFHEIPHIRLGMSEFSSFDGKGISYIQAKKLIDSISESKAFKTLNVRDIDNLSLFISGLGSDRISDLLSNVLLIELIEFNHEIIKKYNLPTISSKNFVNKLRYFDFEDKVLKEVDTQIMYENTLITGESKPLLVVPKNLVEDGGLVLKDSYDMFRFGVVEHINSKPEIFKALTDKEYDVEKLSKKNTEELIRLKKGDNWHGYRAFNEEYLLKYDKKLDSLKIYKNFRRKKNLDVS